jgi:hypothetical protein
MIIEMFLHHNYEAALFIYFYFSLYIHYHFAICICGLWLHLALSNKIKTAVFANTNTLRDEPLSYRLCGVVPEPVYRELVGGWVCVFEVRSWRLLLLCMVSRGGRGIMFER